VNITNWSIKNSLSVLILVFVLIVAGLVSYIGLPREAAPDITIPVVMVTTPYIGVSPSDIETLVTKPLEDELKQLKNVRELRSTSADGASIISIEFEPSVDIDDALQKIRERVDAAKTKIPTDAEDTVIQEISFSEFPIMVVTLSSQRCDAPSPPAEGSDSASGAAAPASPADPAAPAQAGCDPNERVGLMKLKQIAEQLQDRIESIPGILEVKLTGALEQEVHVEANPEMLAFYKVNLNELIGTIQRENLTMPGGTVPVGTQRYSVRVPGEFDRVDEIEQLVIRYEEGQPILVSDVATVSRGFEERKTMSRVNGQESISVSISRRAGENIPEIAAKVKELVKEFEGRTGSAITYTILADVSKDIQLQVEDLENNILTGLILVVAVLLFFMGGLRNALFVAVAIPLSMLLSFIVISAMGITLNIVVLFSLVLALGMLVDNAIVIVENIYRHMNMGKDRVQAAMDGTEEVAWPVISSTATTVGAFFPMMFWPGIMGEFMYYMPLMVVVVLLSSLFIALVVNPVLCAVFMKPAKVKHDPNRKPLISGDDPDGELAALPNNFLYKMYAATLRFAVNQRLLIVLASIGTLVFTFKLYGERNAGVEFFPETTPERIFISFTLPDGSNLDATDLFMHRVEKVLAPEQKHMKTWVTDVGRGGGDGGMGGGGGAAEHLSQITIDFFPEDEQTESPYDIMARMRTTFDRFIGVEVNIAQQANGPPTGPPINIELVGSDYDKLGDLAQEASRLIRDTDGLVNLKDDFSSGRSEVTVHVNRAAAARAGLSTSDVANTVRSAINGIKASTFREDDDELDIIVRLDPDSRTTIEDIRDLKLKNKDGDTIDLADLATVIPARGYGSIRHIDGDRVVTLSAEAAKGFNADALLKTVQDKLSSTFLLPPGYKLRYTGQNKDQAEAQTFLSKALLGALFIIVFILVTQFNSILQPFMIMVSVILSLLGVLWMLMLRQLPFSVIMTGVGVISLAGVVVNNAIVLIDYINQLKARGIPTKQAVIQAGVVRLRPVLLTTVTTLLSLLPIVLGFSLDVKNGRITHGGRSVEMWGPMANAVVAGLVVATILTLVVIPVMYSGLDSIKGLFQRKKAKAPSPDEAAPLTPLDQPADPTPEAPTPEAPAPEAPAPEAPAPEAPAPEAPAPEAPAPETTRPIAAAEDPSPTPQPRPSLELPGLGSFKPDLA
jgi:multidrug efflux pump